MRYQGSLGSHTMARAVLSSFVAVAALASCSAEENGAAGMVLILLVVFGLLAIMRMSGPVAHEDAPRAPASPADKQPDGEAVAAAEWGPRGTRYKMIQIPPNVAVTARGMFERAPSTQEVAAKYLEAVVNREAADGWDFMRIDQIGVSSSPGCLAGLFGAKESVELYYVITFKRAA